MSGQTPIRPKTTPTGFPISGAARERAIPVEVKEETLDHVRAARVKACYIQERDLWESLKAGTDMQYTPGRALDGKAAATIEGQPIEKPKQSVWQKIVDWCDSRKINPETYVRVAFMDLLLQNMAPEPGQLLGEVYLDKWTRMHGTLQRRFEIDLHIQKEAAKTELIVRQCSYGNEYEYACLQVIGVNSLDLSPLFRYCLAVSIGTRKLLELSQRYRTQAVLQFESHRLLYKKVWAGWLPPGFSKLSRKLYPQILIKMGLGAHTYRPTDPAEG